MKVSSSARPDSDHQPRRHGGAGGFLEFLRGSVPPWPVAAVAVAYLALHLPALAPNLEDVDSINFALGLREFDPARHQPHPPGYPVFIAMGRVSLALVSAVSPALTRTSAEALALAKRCGVDPATVREVLMGGIASSRVLDVFGKRMVERDFANGIDTRLYHKDLDIALGLVHGHGMAAPAASVVMQHINAAIGRGEGESDLSVLIDVLEGMSRKA